MDNVLHLIDVMAVARTYYENRSIPQFSWQVDGKTVGTKAIFGLCQTLRDVKSKSDTVVFCKDTRSFRKDISDEYKAGRYKAAPEFYEQVNTAMDIFEDAGFNVIGVEGMEADDVIASLKTKYHDSFSSILIRTNDNDLVHLIDKKTTIIKTTKSKPNIGISNYEEVLGIPYNTMILYKCIVGDTSDNIHGIRGAGPGFFREFINRVGGHIDLATLGSLNFDETVSILVNNLGNDIAIQQAIESYKLVAPLINPNIEILGNNVDWVKLQYSVARYGMKR